MEPIRILEGSAQHRMYRLVGFGLIAALALLLPFLLPDFQISRLNRALAFSVAVLGLNLVVGYSGLLALCQSAFVAIGAFTTGSLVEDHNWDYWMTLPMAMLFAFAFGVLLGIPALKIKGLYLALATVAFAAAFPSFTKFDFWGIAERTGGANGRNMTEELVPPQWAQDLPFGFNVEQPARYKYFFILAVTVCVFWAVSNLVKSRAGRAVISIRDNETGAAVSGVNLRRFKVANFALSAAIGGLAGALWTTGTSNVHEINYDFNLMVLLLVALVVGGVATIGGNLIGALIVVFVREWAKNQSWNFGFYTLDGNGPLSQAIFGIVLIVVVFFAPQGLVGLIRKIRGRFVEIVPKAPELPEGAVSISPDAVVDSLEGAMQ